MLISVKKNDNITALPTNANDGDAGYDIIATSEPEIVGEVKEDVYYKRIDYIQYHTDLFISPYYFKIRYGGETLFDGFHTLIHPRSSISKYNLVLKNSLGLIDFGYRGELLLRFTYILQPEDLVIKNNEILCKININKIYKKGDKVGQLVGAPTIPLHFSIVDNLDETKRNTGGFGSSDAILDNKNESLLSNILSDGKNSILDKYKISTSSDNNIFNSNLPYSETVKQREQQ